MTGDTAGQTGGDFAAQLDLVAGSAAALERALAGLGDEAVQDPSLLPGWTRGHVLTHLARSADALLNLVAWARTGVETAMYPSREARTADIESGARRVAADLVRDVQETQARLMTALASLDEGALQRRLRVGASGREVPASMLATLRRVEIEVHHVDLDRDYTPAHWPPDFVRETLDRTVADYDARTDSPSFTLIDLDDDTRWTVRRQAGAVAITGEKPALLAWLLGRTDGEALNASGPLPTLEAWR